MMYLGMQIKQKQNQSLSQKMIQAVKILEMSYEELAEYLREEIIANSIIDWKEQPSQQYGPNQEHCRLKSKDEILTPRESLALELRIHLEKVVSSVHLDEALEIGDTIIDHLNEQGLLKTPTEEIASLLNVEVTLVEKIIKLLQQIEPLGVGSRDLREFIMIQMKAKKIEDEKLNQLVENHLYNLQEKKASFVCRQLEISSQQLEDYLKIIKNLCSSLPKLEEKQETQYAYPELKAVVNENNQWTILWIAVDLPQLYVPSAYINLAQSSEDLETQAFIKDYVQQALWLIRNIDERKNKIVAVATYLINYQKDYLMGKGALRPLYQKNVAEELGLSDATISRIVKNKLIETPSGTYLLNHFFTNSIKTSQGAIASEKLKEEIRRIVEGEDKRKPYSDLEIEKILSHNKIDVSRRTIAKYRKKMNILNSNKRKE